MNTLTITRRGSIQPSKFTDNQCKDIGHRSYQYQLCVIFDGSTPLDKDGFIVKHEDLDEYIQKSQLEGSCEQMHLILRRRLEGFFIKRKIWKDVLAIKCTIYPMGSDIKEGAFMEGIYVADHAPEKIGILL